MNDAILRTPPADNEPTLSYAPGSPERARLKSELDVMLGGGFEVPLVIGGKEIRTGRTAPIGRPDEIAHPLGFFHLAGEAEAAAAVDSALAAKREWASTPWEERAAIFRRAAELISGKYRARMVAATMLGQSKTPREAEIDAVGEAVDFLRINPAFMERIYAEQPASLREEWNRIAYRPLEGFVYAVTPFNFTAIATNLPSAPRDDGQRRRVEARLYLHPLQLLRHEGLRGGRATAGSHQFPPRQGKRDLQGPALARQEFAGLHFTGSTAVFNSLWKQVAENLSTYRSYPRLVGETGGKDFVFVDPSADPETVLVALVRGAFEYQGQKCSAASRVYLPRSWGKDFAKTLAALIDELPMGKVTDFHNFAAAVIDETSFDGIMAYVRRAASSTSANVLAGGQGDKGEGYFIRPTLIEAKDPRYETMVDELFGPVLTAYAYDDGDMEAAYRLVDSTSPYALTGAIFARERKAITRGLEALRDSAGNLYVNDKPTGAVVGRQPFGGMRASGTNDKAGSILNLVRWTSPCVIKENFNPPTDWRYPYMA